MKYIIEASGYVKAYLSDDAVVNLTDNDYEVVSDQILDISKVYAYRNGIFFEIPSRPKPGMVWDGTNWVKPIIQVSYNEKRKVEYPALEEQLDMLYHAMDKGEIPKATEWYNIIKSIKENNPK